MLENILLFWICRGTVLLFVFTADTELRHFQKSVMTIILQASIHRSQMCLKYCYDWIVVCIYYETFILTLGFTYDRSEEQYCNRCLCGAATGGPYNYINVDPYQLWLPLIL